MHTLTQPIHLGARFELQALAAQFQLQRVFDATNIADTHRQKRRVKAVIGIVFGDAQLRRQLETPADAVVGMEQPRLVDAPCAQLGLHFTVKLKTVRQEIQTTALFTGDFVAFVEFFIELPLAHGLAIRHHHHRAGEALGVAGAAGNVHQDAIAQLLAVTDDAVDHQQWNQQQQDQQRNRAKFEKQAAVHGSLPVLMGRVWAACVGDLCGQCGDCVEMQHHLHAAFDIADLQRAAVQLHHFLDKVEAQAGAFAPAGRAWQ